MNRCEKILTKKWLIENYHLKGKTFKEMAKLAEVSMDSINRYVNFYGLNKKLKYKYILTKNFLTMKLINQKKSILQLSRELKIADCTLHKYIKLHKINIKKGKFYSRQKEIQQKLTYKFLKKELFKKRKNLIQISKETGISRSVISKYAKKFNIKNLKNLTSQKQTEFEAIINNQIHSWSKYQKFRTDILSRDLYTCRVCGKKGNNIHHKIPKRIKPELCFHKRNVITVCESCHTKLDSKYRKENK